MESLKTYRGNQMQNTHYVLEGVVWDRQELIDFYKQFDESCHLPGTNLKRNIIKQSHPNTYR